MREIVISTLLDLAGRPNSNKIEKLFYSDPLSFLSLQTLGCYLHPPWFPCNIPQFNLLFLYQCHVQLNNCTGQWFWLIVTPTPPLHDLDIWITVHLTKPSIYFLDCSKISCIFLQYFKHSAYHVKSSPRETNRFEYIKYFR